MPKARRSGAKKYRYYAIASDIEETCFEVFKCKDLLKRTFPTLAKERGILEIEVKTVRFSK